MVHFYSQVPDEILQLSNQQAVERFAQDAGIPAAAITGLTDDQLQSLPVPNTWSIQQIVMHLLDTDLVAAYRMKRIIAEDRPLLDVYDETRFANGLGYSRQDATMACEVFRLNRLMVARMLSGLPDAAFGRVARHPEVGDLALGQLLRLYVHHLRHHLRFLEQKRAMIGG